MRAKVLPSKKLFGELKLTKFLINPPLVFLWIVAILINVIWAVAYPLTKEVLQDYPAIGLSFWRLLGGAVILFPLLRRNQFPAQILQKDIFLLILMGVMGSAAATLIQFWATEMTYASHVSMIIAVEPLCVMALAMFFLGEKVNRSEWVGVLVAFLGVATLSISSQTAHTSAPNVFAGNLLMIASILCYASYTILGKVLSARWGAGALTVLPFFISVLAILPFVFAQSSQDVDLTFSPNIEQLKVIFFISVLGTGFTYWAWNWLVGHMSAIQVSRSLYVQPLAGVLASIFLLGESLNSMMIGGMFLTLIGVLWAEIKSTRV